MKSLFIKSQWHHDKKSFWLYIPLILISAFSQQPGTQVCSQELLQSQSWLPVFRPSSPCAVFPYEASRMARTPVFESWAVRLRVRWVVGSHKYLKYFQDSAKAWHLGSRKFVTCTNLFPTLSVRELKKKIQNRKDINTELFASSLVISYLSPFSDTDSLLHVVSFLFLEGLALKNKQLIEPKGVKYKGK